LISAAIVAVVLAVGVAGGALAEREVQRFRPQNVLLLQPAPISGLTDNSAVAIKGRVDEIYGNKFIVQDDSGRMLVDTGPRGEAASPVAKGETVTVQGQFDRGFIHANVLTRADGTTEAFGPPGPPPPRPGHGPGAGPAPEPPPPPGR
jgi:uncharacterized protein YdeI (BOF family)